ncbi:hypothetical protein D3C78_1924500 [compost metagenome]
MSSLVTFARLRVAWLPLIVIPACPGLPMMVAWLMFRVEPDWIRTLWVVALTMFSVLLLLTT